MCEFGAKFEQDPFPQDPFPQNVKKFLPITYWYKLSIIRS